MLSFLLLVKGTRSFDYGPGTNAAVVQNSHSNGFQPYVFAENVPRKCENIKIS